MDAQAIENKSVELALTHLPNIEQATNLDELQAALDALRDGLDTLLDTLPRDSSLGEAIDSTHQWVKSTIDIYDLPSYGGTRPITDGTDEVVSWDNTHVILMDGDMRFHKSSRCYELLRLGRLDLAGEHLHEHGTPAPFVRLYQSSDRDITERCIDLLKERGLTAWRLLCHTGAVHTICAMGEREAMTLQDAGALWNEFPGSRNFGPPAERAHAKTWAGFKGYVVWVEFYVGDGNRAARYFVDARQI